MTLDKKTVEKIREMYAEGAPKRQISKKLGVAVNTVAKYTKDDNNEKPIDERKEVNGIPQIDQLEEELQIAGLKPEIQWRLSQTIDFLEDVEEPNSENEALLRKLDYLRNKLENVGDIETVEWVESKCDEVIQYILKEIEKDAEKARKEAEQKQKAIREKYNRNYHIMKESLAITLDEVNDFLNIPLTVDEKKQVIDNVIIYGMSISFSKVAGRLAKILRDYLASQEQINAINDWWRKRIYGNHV